MTSPDPQSTVPVEPLSAEEALAEAIHETCDWEHYIGHDPSERDDMLAASLIPALARRGFTLDAARASQPVTATALAKAMRAAGIPESHVAEALAALPVREDEPTGIDVEAER